MGFDASRAAAQRATAQPPPAGSGLAITHVSFGGLLECKT